MTLKTLTHKMRFDPTCKQEKYFLKACGTARFAWNWALAKWNEKYKAGGKPSAFSLKKEFNSLKEKEFSWVYEVTKYACQQPFIYLQKAFSAFFEKRAKYPKFKKKGIHDSFYVGADQLKVQANKVKIPNLGWVRLRESLRFSGKINGAVISRSANYWFISFSINIDQQFTQCESQASVGVDLGIKTLATLSDGKAILNPKPLKKQLRRLKRCQRRLSKKQKGSQNFKKAKTQLAKVHYRVSCKRNDNVHKLTTHLTLNYKNIAIENLDISGMVKNSKFARDILDGGWHEFKRQLLYKAELRGNKIFVADQWFASSKTCSCCHNYKKELSLSERTYECSYCGLSIDRDLNAAKCLEKLINTASFAGIDACGQDGPVIMLKGISQPAWMNQELSPV